MKHPNALENAIVMDDSAVQNPYTVTSSSLSGSLKVLPQKRTAHIGTAQQRINAIAELEAEAARSGRNLSTAELVRILNERLQPEEWREDEMPPEYPTSQP
ncbi:hypothetical protein BT96DRAFT_596547 [Gymnopus androsaceus JB14]|uniref:Uncharacterized protein n=1 Tax=Gymnopus androsaceus JB14 TaxID=1447944 RepID=A0A6A4GJE2_9AGAR|nr:hypothetical protein BT96DRAFT_596547 [Gymnopus androsaceus JB14]